MGTCNPSAPHQVLCCPTDPRKSVSKPFVTNELSSVALFNFISLWKIEKKPKTKQKAWDGTSAHRKLPGIASGVRWLQGAFGCTFLSGWGRQGSTRAVLPAHWL